MIPGGGGWLRILLAISCSLTMFTIWIRDLTGVPQFVQIVVALGLTLWVVMRPAAAAAGALLLTVLAVRMLKGGPHLDGQLIGLVILLPLVHQLAALATVVPLPSTLRWRAVLPTALRYTGAVLSTVAGLLVAQSLGW